METTIMKSLRTLKQFGRRLAVWMTSAALALALGACGGGSDDTAGSSSGEVVIGLTDAEGDFLSYTVDVISITLTRADGSVVETLPLSTRVDFAQYTEMTEFVTAATIPSGIYTSARLRIDYSNADIQVEKGGVAVAAIARDTLGNTLSTLELDVRFDENRAIVILPGVPAHLTLDFNLAASNQVDTTPATPVVTVEPFLIADVNPQAPKTHRVRGPLRSVDVADSSFRIGIRPFLQMGGEHGGLTVNTNSATAFEIDGTAYDNADGLVALAARPAGTAVVAVGDLQVQLHRFVAREVYAGSSVPYGTSDVVTGSVIARSGDLLTVRGATLVRADGTFTFRDTVEVQIGDATKIVKQASPAATPTKADISIGSHVTAFGSLQTGGGTPLLDAGDGLARLLVTSVRGSVNSVSSGSLEMAVQFINGRPVSFFNFAGTGTSAAQDADPLHYEVALGLLTGNGLTAGTPVRVKGFVKPFGAAPADFNALTVVNLATTESDLRMAWNPATGAPFTTLNAGGLTLNTDGVGLVHHLWRDGVVTDLLSLPKAPVVTPRDATHGLYAIGYQGSVQVYTQFDQYQLALGERLGAGQKARAFGARGVFDDSAVELSASSTFAALQ
jgi:hypothetical protein